MWILSLLDWITRNWQYILQVGLILFLLSLVKPIKDFIKTALVGIKEGLDPLGFFVILVLALLFIVISGLF